MWIFCCGAKRSGSTLQFNIASEIVELKNKGSRQEHCVPGQFPALYKDVASIPGFKVFKTHELTAEMLEIIEKKEGVALYTFRDIRDVVVSNLKKGWIEHTQPAIEKYVEEYVAYHNRILAVSQLGIQFRKYESFYNNLENEIGFVASCLGIPLNKKEIHEIAEKLSPSNVTNQGDGEMTEQGKFRFNKKTLLHENHIQGRVPDQYLKDLTENEILSIEKIAYKYLEENNYKLYWPQSNYFLSLSQQADDYILFSLFNGKRTGKIVEVGAFDGIHLSNSYSLEKSGWTSVCVEPNPKMFSFLKQNRPLAKNLNYAVVGDESLKHVEFKIEEIGVLSGITVDNDDVSRRYKARGINFGNFEIASVPAATLNSIFNECGIQRDDIDVLSIDVEGYEMEVLKGLDLTQFAPRLILIEANSKEYEDAIMGFFGKQKIKYELIARNSQNLNIALSSWYRGQANRTPVNYDKMIVAKQYHPTTSTFSIQASKSSFAFLKKDGFFKRFFQNSK
jgi:FkbM family methyltransferase